MVDLRVSERGIRNDVKKTRPNTARNVPPDKVAELPQAVKVAKKRVLKKFERVINLLSYKVVFCKKLLHYSKSKILRNSKKFQN